MTVPKPAAPTVTEAPGEEPFELLPEHIEPFLVSPSGWSRLEDNLFGTGPVDLARAAAGQAREGGSVEEARQYLEQLGFLARYSRAWEPPGRTGAPAVHATTAVVTLYVFGTVEAPRVYAEDSMADFAADTDPETWQEMSVGDVPGASGWTGGNEDDGYLSIVGFPVDGVFVGVGCMSTTSYQDDHRRCAEQVTRMQYSRLVELLEL